MDWIINPLDGIVPDSPPQKPKQQYLSSGVSHISIKNTAGGVLDGWSPRLWNEVHVLD